MKGISIAMRMGLLFPFILHFSLTPDFGTAEALLLLESSREIPV